MGCLPFRFKSIAKDTQSGFSLLELVVVVAVLAILAGIAIPSFQGVVRSARQAAATSYVDAILKSSTIFRAFKGRWPTTWVEMQQYSGSTGAGALSSVESCSLYGSVCNGNERVIVGGQYLINYWSQGGEMRVSAWRFNNTGPTSQNRSVWGCVGDSSILKIVSWQKDGSFWQGPSWDNDGGTNGMKDDDGNDVMACSPLRF